MLHVRTIRIGAVVIALGLSIFLSVSRFAEPFREFVLDGIAPVFRGFTKGTEFLTRAARGSEGERIRLLEEERIKLLQEIANREELKKENELLRGALALTASGEETVIPAFITAFLREGRDEYILINRGMDDGVTAGDVVVDHNRVLVGIVQEASRRTSRIGLITSPSQTIDVLFAGTELRGLSRGNNAKELLIELVPQDADVKIGDLIVASPRAVRGRTSLLIGQVRDVKNVEHEIFKEIRAEHLFQPSDIGVLVLPSSSL